MSKTEIGYRVQVPKELDARIAVQAKADRRSKVQQLIILLAEACEARERAEEATNVESH